MNLDSRPWEEDKIYPKEVSEAKSCKKKKKYPYICKKTDDIKQCNNIFQAKYIKNRGEQSKFRLSQSKS